MNSIKNSARKKKKPKKGASQKKPAAQQRSKNPIGQEKIQKKSMFNRGGSNKSVVNALYLLSGPALAILISPMSFAQTYTGDAADLTSIRDLPITNIDSTSDGVISSTGIVPNASDTNLKIDYTSGTSPEFALAGYAGATNARSDNYKSSRNILEVQSGQVFRLFSGYAAYGFQCDAKIFGSGCANLNSQDINDNNKILDSSNNTIIIRNLDNPIIFSEVNAGTTLLKSSVEAKLNTHLANNISTSNNNAIFIEINDSELTIVRAGHNIYDISSKIGASGTGVAFLNHDGNTLQSLNNRIVVKGSNNEFGGIFASGYNYAVIGTGDSSAIPRSNVTSTFNNNILRSSFNVVDIGGVNNMFATRGSLYNIINSGKSSLRFYLYFKVADGSVTTSLTSIDNTAIDASHNIFSISGKNHDFSNANIIAGNSVINYFMDFIHIQGESQASLKNTKITANDNLVRVKGSGHQFNDIYGGYSSLLLAFGKISADTPNGTVNLSIDVTNSRVSADQNKVFVSGESSINGNIYGGYDDFKITYEDPVAGNADITIVPDENIKFTANNNTISINGSHGFASDSSIYGGYINSEIPTTLPPGVNVNNFKRYYDTFTGNTLNYNNSTPISIANIGNFQNYNFTIDPATANSGVAMITADKITFGTNATNLGDGYPGAAANSVVKVVGIRSGKPLDKGSEFILMDSANNIDGKGVGGRSIVHQGIALSYQVNTLVKDKQVIAIISSVAQANSQLKALLEGHLSGITLLTRGADMVAENLLGVISQQNNHQGLAPFLTTSGNRSRYNTGSSIKSNAGIITGGLSWQQEQVTLAAFIENGWDSYKSHNDFKEADDVNGRGHNNYYGVGLYGHYDFMNGWYSDASLRVGRIRTAFDTDDIRNADGEHAAYNISSTYYGAHLAGGYIVALNADNTLDVSVKYLWSGTQGQNVTVAGERMHFDKLNSQRLRLNAENSYQLNPQLTLLAGLGYEYEFDGKAKGTTYGFNIDEPSLKGSTGIATVGARYVPDANNNLNLNVKLNGYSGKREGGGASFDVSYKF